MQSEERAKITGEKSRPNHCEERDQPWNRPSQTTVTIKGASALRKRAFAFTTIGSQVTFEGFGNPPLSCTEEHITFGIETSKVAAKQSNKLMDARGGCVVHAPAVEGIERFDDNFFAGIIMRSYLEHEAQP